MSRLLKSILLILFILFFHSVCAFAEDITITTYYPSPNGSYSSLQTERLGVGDNNADGSFTSADVPTNPGDAWIKGNITVGHRWDSAATTTDVNIGKPDGSGGWTAGSAYIRFKDNLNDGSVNAGTYISFHPHLWSGGTNERMRITGIGNVGIGTTNPTAKLDVNGNVKIDSSGRPITLGGNFGTIFIQGDTGGWAFGLHAKGSSGTDRGGFGFYGGADSLNYYYIGGSYSSPAMVIQSSNGNVGIGTTSPTYQLQLSTDSAAKPGTNTWTIVSDARIKKDIHPYTNGLSIIKRINPVWFKYNGKAGFPNDNQEHIGVIAQEIVKVAPYTVNTFRGKLNPEDKKETDLLNFNSHALTFDLINAVKELDNNITKLSQENQELRLEMENLKTRLSSLETKTK